MDLYTGPFPLSSEWASPQKSQTRTRELVKDGWGRLLSFILSVTGVTRKGHRSAHTAKATNRTAGC